MSGETDGIEDEKQEACSQPLVSMADVACNLGGVIELTALETLL